MRLPCLDVFHAFLDKRAGVECGKVTSWPEKFGCVLFHEFHFFRPSSGAEQFAQPLALGPQARHPERGMRARWNVFRLVDFSVAVGDPYLPDARAQAVDNSD